MGIPSYFSHIVKEHRNIIKNLTKDFYIDNLYLDSNSIIYDGVHSINSINNSNFEKELITWICNKIEFYINTLKPKQRLFIAFDGVAPVAKLEQQRSRRYKSWYQNKIQNEILALDKGVISSGQEIISTWNTAAITPGTFFMEKLGKQINKHFSNAKKYGLQEIIVSSSNEPGEGEHKIYKYIRDNPEYHLQCSSVIYGLDADLIMLTLNHLDISPNMYLYRETPHFIQSIDKSLEPSESYIMDIPEFASCLKSELKVSLSLKNDESCIKDYVFLCFLLGNDFLPHFPALNIRTNGIDCIMDVYKTCSIDPKFHLITKSNNIVWRNFRKLIMMLAEEEHNYLKDEYNVRRKAEKNVAKYYFNKDVDIKERKKQIEEKLLHLPLKERQVEEYINPYERGWEHRYYKTLIGVDIDDERRKQIATNYIEGLEWTLKYYTADCPDWSWKYNYNYPPLLTDLAKYIPYFDIEFISKQKTLNTGPVEPIVQLSYVLPRASMDLLPKKVLKRITKEYPEKYTEWYGDNYDFEWAFCKYFWESHVKMPEIDLNELKAIVCDV